MPEKYHIDTRPVPPRRPRIGKYGVVDWREDCARCHNCVKKACIYDRHRQEMDYIRNLSDVDALFFDCMGCFSCVQECTKGLLCMSINPAFEQLGDDYWTPDIIRTTWLQAETAKIPVSGAGYGGPFSGSGFDAMWTDMSEIVRPTRDGIHGREYISTSVDIGRKPLYIPFGDDTPLSGLSSLVTLPMPLLIDASPPEFSLPRLAPIKAGAALRTEVISFIHPSDWPLDLDDAERYLPYLAFRLDDDKPRPPDDIIGKTRLVEIPFGESCLDTVRSLKERHPDIVTVVRIPLDGNGVKRAIDLAVKQVEALHIVADADGNEIGAEKPRFLTDMIRELHTALVDRGIRDEVTVIAGGGIALPEHMAKAIICGADIVSIDNPLMIGLECHYCHTCAPGSYCPAKLEEIDFDYGVGRMTNLIAAWHGQLIEVMGAMGMREVRRLRGETGRAMFFDDLERDTFGKLFGTRTTTT